MVDQEDDINATLYICELDVVFNSFTNILQINFLGEIIYTNQLLCFMFNNIYATLCEYDVKVSKRNYLHYTKIKNRYKFYLKIFSV